MGNSESLAKQLEQVNALLPSNPEEAVKLCTKAIHDHEQQLENMPDVASKIYLQRALAHRLQDHVELSLCDATTTLKHDPKCVQAYELQLLALRRQHRPEVAVEVAKAALAECPDAESLKGLLLAAEEEKKRIKADPRGFRYSSHLDPTEAWEEMPFQKVISLPLPLVDINQPVAAGYLRLVCISDTHGKHRQMEPLPAGDVLVHAGDFTNTGEAEQVQDFEAWLGEQPHRHKLVIAGNHDVTFHPEYYTKTGKDRFHRRSPYDPEHVRSILLNSKNCTYLEDQAAILDGVTFWGSPWQPEFCDWGFNMQRGSECRQKWESIPDKVDVLVTHGPPIGHGDKCQGMFGAPEHRAGCLDLLRTVQHRVKPAQYQPINDPIVVDVPIPSATPSEDAIPTK